MALIATNRPGVPNTALMTYRGSLVDGNPVSDSEEATPTKKLKVGGGQV